MYEKIPFTITDFFAGAKVVCRSICFTPLKVQKEDGYIHVYLQLGFSEIDDKPKPTQKIWLKYHNNGRLYKDITCGMDLMIELKN